MKPRSRTAEEARLSWIERWSPQDAEIWARWRASLSDTQRADALLPLQAMLSGLAAFRHLENDPRAAPATDFRPHLHASRVSFMWGLELVDALRSAPPMHHVERSWTEPEASLDELRRSLTDALRICERLVTLPVVDAGIFRSSCDLFLRDLDRNAFFRPSEPLEFSNVAELIDPEYFSTEARAMQRDPAKTATLVAFLALLRDHRFLGIADRQMREFDGIYRAYVVIAGARRELRTLERFLIVQGAETSADELHARLLSLDAHGYHIDDPLPDLDADRGLALPSERMRNAIRELRRAVRATAKQLLHLDGAAALEPIDRESARVRKDLSQDIWAFRFILRAFLAKARAASTRVGALDDEQLAFAGEFVRHFRTFGPRLAKGTGYERRGPLTTALSALSRRDTIDVDKLAFASQECERFADHLDRALEEALRSRAASFDKHEAAEELRAYLANARAHAPSAHPPEGAFGSSDATRFEAG